MKDNSKILMLCSAMLALIGIYYAVALIFVTKNMLIRELSFAMEHNTIGVYLHVLFIFSVHILASSLFLYSAIGVSKQNNKARKLGILILCLNLFTVFSQSTGSLMLYLKIIVFLISLSALILLLNKTVKKYF